GAAAAGHADVAVLSGRCGFDAPVRGGCGDARRRVRRPRVAEADMLAYVGGRQDDGPAVSPARSADGDRPVVADSGDGPTFAVADPVVALRRRRSLRRVMIVAPTPAVVPSWRSTSRPGVSVPSRIRSARARWFSSVTSSRDSAISTDTRPRARSARHAE